MSAPGDHRRPPAERLFCRADGDHAARPGMAAGEQAHFAEHFAKDFAAALSETRREGDGPSSGVVTLSPSPNPLP
jgi:hypothetical protein